MLTVGLVRASCLAALALFVPGTGGAADAADAAAGEWGTVRAPGLAPGLPSWRVLRDAARGHAQVEGAEGRRVPLPLRLETWRRLLRRPALDDGEVIGAILADRRTAQLYLGLSSFDEETLAALAAEPEVLEAIHDRHAEVLGLFAGRFRVRNGKVAVPGGPEAEPLWQSLVGEPLRDPAEFLLALLRSGGGRRAFLYDSIARLDPDRQRFALGLGHSSLGARVLALMRLASVFDREAAWWRPEGGAFARPEVDAARLLREVRVESGALAPPTGRRFWEAVFGEAAGEAATADGEGDSVDAVWLAERIASGDVGRRRPRLLQLAFAQRVFREAAEAEPGPVLAALQGMGEAETLLLALERVGARDPGLYADGVLAARGAGRHGGAEGQRAQRGLQGALALLDRARFARTLDGPAAAALARSLFAVPFGEPRAWPGALATWVGEALLPGLSRAVYGERPAGDAETTVLRAMAGDTVDDEAPLEVFEWEGLAYRADLGRAEFTRLERVRARQRGTSLAEGMAACGPAAEAGPCGQRLGAALASLAYAAHLGDPEGPALSGSDPAERHDFGPSPWSRPVEVSGPSVPWHVRGSLLGLEGALAGLSLHRLDGDAMPEEPPVLDALHRRLLVAAGAWSNPRDLTDAGRDAVARAVEAGRRRVAALRPASPEADSAAREAGLEPWRARALEWLLENDPSSREGFFSLAELLRLGGGAGEPADAWGTVDELGAGFGVRLPRAVSLDEAAGQPPQVGASLGFVDLNLRVACHLAERRVPARVAPAVVMALLPDLFASARPAAPDDRLGLESWVRGLRPERIDDAVASLAMRGPLQPAPPGAVGGS